MATIPQPRRRLDRSATAEALRLAIGRSARRLRQQAGQELTPTRAALLDTIARDGPVSPSRLAEIERTSRPTITRLVAKLRAQGFVECTPDPDDGRSYQITVSPTGERLRDRRRQRKYAYLARLIENASDEELEVLDHAAKVLIRLLEQEDA